MKRDDFGHMVWAAAFAQGINDAYAEKAPDVTLFATGRATQALIIFDSVPGHHLPWPLTERAPQPEQPAEPTPAE